MKKILLILSLVFIGYTAQSQILITLLLGDKLNSDGLEFGLVGGGNWTTISGLETNDYAHKYNLGFYFDIRIKNQWSLYTGVLVKANMGVDKLTTNDLNSMQATIYDSLDGQAMVGDYSHKMNYFLIPVLLRYNFKNNLNINLGPQFGLMYKSWIEFESDIDGRDAFIKEYNKAKINTIDVGIMIGMGYTLFKGSGWTFGASYYYGLVDVYKDISGTKNSSFFIELNIPIGAGEKPKKDEQKLD